MEGLRANQRPSTTMNTQRRSSSKHAGRARIASSSTGADHDRADANGQLPTDQASVRSVRGLLEKFDKRDMYELLASRDAHWLLTNSDVYKVPTDHPSGLIRQMQPFNETHIDILFPVDESTERLDAREIHQLLRELTIGVYSLNAQPSLSLEANFDLSSTCQMSTAYMDTRLGQVMVSCDAWLKSVWHGVFMPKEKRSKFAERWKTISDYSMPRSIVQEYESSGLQDLQDDPDYAESKDSFQPEIKSEEQRLSDEQFLLTYADDLSMVLTLHLDRLSQYRNCLMFNGNYTIQSQIKAVEARLSNEEYQRLKALLQVHEQYLRKTFALKADVRRYIYILELVCFLYTVFVALKRRMKKIPNLNRLLPTIIGDDVRTERELPPFIYTKKQSTNTFPVDCNTMFHLHGGIQFEYETTSLDDTLAQMLTGKNEACLDASRRILYGYLDLSNTQHVDYRLPIVEIDGKKFYHLVIDIEPYYGLTPVWLRAIQSSVDEALKKRVLNDTIIYEMYKKYFGRKNATNYKNPEQGLRVCAQRGLTCVFQALARKSPSSGLSKANLRDGLTLMHYAAIYNRPIIIGLLILLGVDVNCRQEVNYISTGGTPLHLACRHGSFDAASCLLGNMASIVLLDHQGWTSMHHAAYCDHIPIIRLLHNKHAELLEQVTKDSRQSTPLLLAATSGALDAVQCLVSLHANVACTDQLGHTVIHLAASNIHTNIIEYFIHLNNPLVPTWRILIDLIVHPELTLKRAVVQCLHLMTTHGEEFWFPLLETDGIKRLVALLKTTDNSLILLTLSVLCNISAHAEVRRAVSSTGDKLAEVLSNLLTSTSDEIRSKAAILIADICFVPSNQENFLRANAVSGLSRMLESPIEDVLVNACNAIDLLCRKNEHMQNELAKCGIIEQLTDLLALDSKILRGTVASALASLTFNNLKNQTLAGSMGALRLAVNLMQDREFGIRYKASLAIEALAMNNVENQKELLSKHINVQKPLNELMEKMYYVAATIRGSGEWALEIREQAAFTLWALGGQIKSQQRYVAECLGMSQIVTMLLSHSERLQFIALNAIIALAEEHEENQNKLHKDEILSPLLRLLKQCQQLSHRVSLVLIRAFGALCIGVSLVPNVLLQNAMVEQNVVELLIRIMESTDHTDVKAECCLTLAKLVLNNSENQQRLASEFNVERIVLEFVAIDEPALKLRALLGLALFAYNNLENQCILKQTNALLYDSFRPFIESGNPLHSAMACFQVVILTRVIADTDNEQVTLTALALMKLADLLLQSNISLITQIAKYISSLARIRTGISDALISCGVLERLIDKLYSPSLPQTSDDAGDEIEMHMACAVAIGTLTYNKTAFRLLYNLVRRSPDLYDKIIAAGERSCMSRDFVSFFESERANGLPVDSLSVQLHVLDARPVSSIHRRSTAGSDRETPSRVRTARSRLESQAPSVVSHRPSTARMADRRRLTLSSKSTRT